RHAASRKAAGPVRRGRAARHDVAGTARHEALPQNHPDVKGARRPMCLGIPGEIVELIPGQPELAKVEVAGVRRAINVGLVAEEGIQVGDWVLVHVGFAMSKIDEREAAATLALLRGLGQAYTDELEALAESDIT